MGEIENGIEQNRYRGLDQIWIDQMKRGAHSISTMTHQPLLALSQETYTILGRTPDIGEIRNFNSLKNMSDLSHMPVHFLE